MNILRLVFELVVVFLCILGLVWLVVVVLGGYKPLLQKAKDFLKTIEVYKASFKRILQEERIKISPVPEPPPRTRTVVRTELALARADRQESDGKGLELQALDLKVEVLALELLELDISPQLTEAKAQLQGYVEDVERVGALNADIARMEKQLSIARVELELSQARYEREQTRIHHVVADNKVQDLKRRLDEANN